MTDRQKQTLARFLAASMIAGMLVERLVFHTAVQSGDALQYVGLSTLEIPHVDATFGYLLQRQQSVTWKAIALVGWVLPLLAVTLLCWRGPIARTALCVAAAAYALAGFAVVAPVTVGLITASGLDAGSTVTPMDGDLLQWFGYVFDTATGLADGDFRQASASALTGLIGLGYVALRIAIVGVAGWLAWLSWADRRDPARSVSAA